MTVGLREFASKALEAKRIRFADLRRLQRDVLPCRITNRVEAEVLLALDGTVVRADRDWTDYVVPAVVEFAIWGLEPIGRIDQDKAAWLAAAASTARPKSAAKRLDGRGRLKRNHVDLFALGALVVELDRAFNQREQRVVAADADVVARVDARAALANDDVARDHDFAAELLDAEHLGVGVASVTSRAYALFMCHW